MSNKKDVEKFIEEFITIAKVFDIIIINRQENTEALLDLGITAVIRKEIILSLKAEDYYRGPSEDKDLPGFDMWEFGKIINDCDEVYIKLSTRREKQSCLCISFHRAKFRITYPFKIQSRKE